MHFSCGPIVTEPMTSFNNCSLQFEPYVQEGNEGLVHHLLVYECHGKFNDSLYGPGFDCGNTANIPFKQCFYSNIVAVWAVGGEVRAVGWH